MQVRHLLSTCPLWPWHICMQGVYLCTDPPACVQIPACLLALCRSLAFVKNVPGCLLTACLRAGCLLVGSLSSTLELLPCVTISAAGDRPSGLPRGRALRPHPRPGRGASLCQSQLGSRIQAVGPKLKVIEYFGPKDERKEIFTMQVGFLDFYQKTGSTDRTLTACSGAHPHTPPRAPAA